VSLLRIARRNAATTSHRPATYNIWHGGIAIKDVGEKAKEEKPLVIVYNTGDKTFAELTDFPNLETDSPEVAREKQRRLLGQPAKAPAPKTISDQPEDEEKISDAPPPKVVNPALTGRIKPEWRNGK